jgi:hypothetical protein
MDFPAGASRSYSLDTPQSVGLLWTSDQPDAETSTGQHTTLTKNKHPCPRRDSKLQFQQNNRPHIHALGYGYIGARNETTQQTGGTPDKEVEIKNITFYVSC